MKIRHIYLMGREYKANNGKNVSFWLDTWLGDKPLSKIPYFILAVFESTQFSVMMNELLDSK
jgi:hypothetical protein